MGVYIDMGNMMAGLGVLAEALAERRKRKKMEQFQTATSLFNRIADPMTDTEDRQVLKQQLADILKVDEASQLSDDIGELAGQMDTFVRSKWSDITGSSQGNAYWSEIVGQAKSMNKLDDTYNLVTKTLAQNKDRFDPGSVQLVNEFGSIGDKENATKIGLALLSGSMEAVQGQYNKAAAMQSPAFEQVHELSKIYDLDEWKTVGLTKEYDKLKIDQARALFSHGLSGGGGGSGGKSQKGWGLKDVLAAADDGYQEINKQIPYAMGRRDDAIKNYNEALSTANESGLDPVAMQKTTVANGVSQLQFVALVHAKGAEGAYKEIQKVDPEFTEEDFDAAVEENWTKLDTKQRQAVIGVYSADLKRKVTDAEMQKIKFQLNGVTQLAEDVYKMGKENPGSLDPTSMHQAAMIINVTKGNEQTGGIMTMLDAEQEYFDSTEMTYNQPSVAKPKPGLVETTVRGAASYGQDIAESGPGRFVSDVAQQVWQPIDDVLSSEYYKEGKNLFDVARKLAKGPTGQLELLGEAVVKRGLEEGQAPVRTQEGQLNFEASQSVVNQYFEELDSSASAKRSFKERFSGSKGFEKFVKAYYPGVELSPAEERRLKRRFEEKMR